MLNKRYELLQLAVNSGGQGSIDIYLDTYLERKVAVKRLHAGSDRGRLIDEIHALGEIRSKNVVQVLDVEVDEHTDEIALIQEYIDGDDLHRYVDSNVTLREVLYLLYQLANALCDVHASGVTHRDVNLTNVRVDREGVLKLIDFGLARFIPQQKTVGMVGTLGFMAPELQKFGHVPFTSAVDVFAFAVTAWCLLFEESSPPLEPEDEKISFADTNLSAELASALNRALMDLPSDRPSIAELRSLLERDLCFDQHRATIVMPTEIERLDATRKSASLVAGSLANIELSYDGYAFFIDRLSGRVYVNNIEVMNRRELRGSTLITLGAPSSGRDRVFVRFDVSHPEVTL